MRMAQSRADPKGEEFVDKEYIKRGGGKIANWMGLPSPRGERRLRRSVRVGAEASTCVWDTINRRTSRKNKFKDKVICRVS